MKSPKSQDLAPVSRSKRKRTSVTYADPDSSPLSQKTKNVLWIKNDGLKLFASL